MKRLVLDPNALASGIVDPHSDKPPRLLFEALERLAFEVIVCPKLLGELRKALRDVRGAIDAFYEDWKGGKISRTATAARSRRGRSLGSERNSVSPLT